MLEHSFFWLVSSMKSSDAKIGEKVTLPYPVSNKLLRCCHKLTLILLV